MMVFINQIIVLGEMIIKLVHMFEFDFFISSLDYYVLFRKTALRKYIILWTLQVHAIQTHLKFFNYFLNTAVCVRAWNRESRFLLLKALL